jgi:hypothetical protein
VQLLLKSSLSVGALFSGLADRPQAYLEHGVHQERLTDIASRKGCSQVGKCLALRARLAEFRQVSDVTGR